MGPIESEAQKDNEESTKANNRKAFITSAKREVKTRQKSECSRFLGQYLYCSPGPRDGTQRRKAEEQGSICPVRHFLETAIPGIMSARCLTATCRYRAAGSRPR